MTHRKTSNDGTPAYEPVVARKAEPWLAPMAATASRRTVHPIIHEESTTPIDAGTSKHVGDARRHGSTSCGGGDSCACLPALTSPDDRVTTLRDVLEVEPEPLVSLTQLLRLCRDEPPTLWEHHADPRCRARVSALVARVGHALPATGTETLLAPDARRAIADGLTAVEDIPPVVVAHALAELLDQRYGHVFTDWFRHRSPYQPAVGDPTPLDSPDLRRVTTLPPTAPPWRLANRLDETRWVRLAGAWTTQFRVVFDYSVFDTLAGVIGEDAVIATCHPNRDLRSRRRPRDVGPSTGTTSVARAKPTKRSVSTRPACRSSGRSRRSRSPTAASRHPGARLVPPAPLRPPANPAEVTNIQRVPIGALDPRPVPAGRQP